MSYGKFQQGFYKIINKEKYVGNNKPFFRSSWESRVMSFFDLNTNVVAWSSERVVVPYKLPATIDGTGKVRRYFVDFYCEIKDNEGRIKKFLVEVKPKAQGKPPKQPKRITKSYKSQCMTFMVNQFKWESAKKYCEKKGYKFIVLTEDEIYNMK